MFITDPISDLVVRVKNANARKHRSLSVPYSIKKEAIVKLIEREGYISSYSVEGEGVKKSLVITLKYKRINQQLLVLKEFQNLV